MFIIHHKKINKLDLVSKLTTAAGTEPIYALDANQLSHYAHDTPLSLWPNYLGDNSFDFIQDGSSTVMPKIDKTSWGQNLPCVSFNGSNEWLFNSDAGSAFTGINTPYFQLSVMYVTSSGTYFGCGNSGNGFSMLRCQELSGNLNFRIRSDIGTNISPTGSFPAFTTPSIMAWGLNSSGIRSIRCQNENIEVSVGDATLLNELVTFDIASIGSGVRTSPEAFGGMKLQKTFVWNTELTDEVQDSLIILLSNLLNI